MPLIGKRKRYSKDIKCIYFPGDVKKVEADTSISTTSAAKSWEKCGDSFIGTQLSKNAKSSGTKWSAIRRLTQLPESVYPAQPSVSSLDEEPVHIAWSSSDSELSDSEAQQQPLPRTGPQGQLGHWRLARCAAPSQPHRKASAPIRSYSRALRMLSTQTEDLPSICSDSDVSSTGENVEKQEDSGGLISDYQSDSESHHEMPEELPKPTPVSDADISDYASDGERAETTSLGRAENSSLHAGEGCARSVSDWVRTAQAMLQTPQKSIDRNSKTPEDSSKKRRKFQSGGLAERLNRLQCRQRSAIGFWRHQSISATSAAPVDKPGVLVLEVLSVWEEGSMQLAQCEPHQPGPSPHGAEGPMLVLFNKETAAQLMPAPRDVIHVYPPWQSLRIEGEKSTIVLNTHFSQKVFSDTRQSCESSLVTRDPVEKCRPYSLTRSFGLLEIGVASGSSVKQVSSPQCGSHPGGPGAMSACCHSLLEVIEGLGQAGCVGQDVEVVVQRVYTVPIQERSAGALLRSKVPCRPTAAGSAPFEGNCRLCVLVQDSYGMFSVLQLQPLTSPDRLLHYSCRWQGRTCVLRAIKVVRRVTRERCARLFSLIDSLWPPVKAPQLPGNTPSCQNDSGATGPAPSFCYLLAGQEASVTLVEGTVSPFYLPHAQRTLRQILQGEASSVRCSFVATVIHKRIQSPTSDLSQPEIWLVVTDPSLQEEEEEEGHEGMCRRTLAVCVTTSCVLSTSVVTALYSSRACSVSFRDAVREHGAFLCVEQSILELHTPGPVVRQEGTAEPESPAQPQDQHHAQPRSVRLDPLGPETPANSLCTLSGVIVGVDEDTAYSWPACSLCGSDRLEMTRGTTEVFHCVSCNSMVDQPTVKMQLEASMSCTALNNCTVKVKLQQKTIMSILTSSTSEATEFPGYKVENVLGKEVGPIPVYVRVVTKTPCLWMGLEEICL